MNLKEWRAYESNRQNIISENKARRMRNGPIQPPLEVPPKLPRPKVVQLYDTAGDYIGTWAEGVSEDDARIEAKEQGHNVGKVKWVDA